MNIFFKKNWLVLIICVIFIVAMGFTINMACIQKQKLIDTHKAGLQMLANEKAAQVNMFFEFQKERIANLGAMTTFKEAALYPDDAVKIKAAKDVINEFKSKIPGISVLTKEGIVIVGESDPAGTDYGGTPGFPADDKSVTIFTRYYDPIRKGDYYAVGGPIYDNQEKNKVIGVVAFDIRLDEVSTIMKEAIEIHSNEVYLIDETGLLLSGSEFIGQGEKKGVLVQKVESEGAKLCLEDLKEYTKEGSVEEHPEEVFQYLNYMGDKVFGAHAYAPAINGCVIAEEGADEILGTSMLDYISNIFIKK